MAENVLQNLFKVHAAEEHLSAILGSLQCKESYLLRTRQDIALLCGLETFRFLVPYLQDILTVEEEKLVQAEE